MNFTYGLLIENRFHSGNDVTVEKRNNLDPLETLKKRLLFMQIVASVLMKRVFVVFSCLDICAPS